MADRIVMIPARSLDDLLELARMAVDRLARLEPDDPLTSALRGVIANARAGSILEP